MNVEQVLTQIAFWNREYQVSHLEYEQEIAFFESVQAGDIEQVRERFQPFESKKMGTLSENPLQNLKYHFIITIALMTRYCIEGGMEMEEAFNLSDIYICSADHSQKEQQIQELHLQAVEDFTQRMQLIHQKHTMYSKPVLQVLDYIYRHLHTKITLKQLAKVAYLSPSYLSRLFHAEIGIPVSQYIRKKRVDAAENMLKFSNYSSTEIANYLCFSSESHFIQVFKKEVGQTPKQYREQFFRKNWDVRK